LVQTVTTIAADTLAIPPTPDGFYSFNLDPGSYTVCEEQRAGWTQTTPLLGSVPPPVGESLALCAPFGVANGLTLGPRGYNFTVLATEILSNNNFGNFQDESLVVPLTDFRDVRRPNDIAIGPDLGRTGQQVLNFTGTAGAGGDTWITVYDPAPNPPPVTFGSVSLSADVLIHAFNNKKGAGLLALYNEAPSKKGLALTLYNAGNTDTLVLAAVDQAGKLVPLKTVSLGAGIAENAWYRVNMEVTVDAGLVDVIGTVFRHQTPTDPDSPPTTQVGLSLTFSGTLGAGGLVGVDATGEVGILAAAVNAANSSSVTNFTVDP